jgi:hypothetical protein
MNNAENTRGGPAPPAFRGRPAPSAPAQPFRHWGAEVTPARGVVTLDGAPPGGVLTLPLPSAIPAKKSAGGPCLKTLVKPQRALRSLGKGDGSVLGPRQPVPPWDRRLPARRRGQGETYASLGLPLGQTPMPLPCGRSFGPLPPLSCPSPGNRAAVPLMCAPV